MSQKYRIVELVTATGSRYYWAFSDWNGHSEWVRLSGVEESLDKVLEYIYKPYPKYSGSVELIMNQKKWPDYAAE